ncbi:hypothetical protein DFJ73DRAFT_794437 [Zopfochytrium polystomum]|nr:hypothetical protein DFJ73DRAFT_794437 [Zopfochytrium polystomum]
MIVVGTAEQQPVDHADALRAGSCQSGKSTARPALSALPGTENRQQPRLLLFRRRVAAGAVGVVAADGAASPKSTAASSSAVICGAPPEVSSEPPLIAAAAASVASSPIAALITAARSALQTQQQQRTLTLLLPTTALTPAATAAAAACDDNARPAPAIAIGATPPLPILITPPSPIPPPPPPTHSSTPEPAAPADAGGSSSRSGTTRSIVKNVDGPPALYTLLQCAPGADAAGCCLAAAAAIGGSVVVVPLPPLCILKIGAFTPASKLVGPGREWIGSSAATVSADLAVSAAAPASVGGSDVVWDCAVKVQEGVQWRPEAQQCGAQLGVGGKGCKGVLRPWRRIYLPQFHGHGAAAEDSDGNKEGAALQDTAAIFGATVGQRRSGGGGMAPVKLLRASRPAEVRRSAL